MTHLSIKALCALFAMLHTLSSFSAHIDRRTLLSYNDEGPLLLKPSVGKTVVLALLKAHGKAKTTTSCRLENKCAVFAHDLECVLANLSEQGFDLEDRETKNVPPGAHAGTFTLYGAAAKFVEAKNLPKTSIKMRIRAYIIEHDGVTKRAVGTESSAFLEIKIKNPFPDYPLSVHKYRLMVPDEDILMLINADPDDQDSFSEIIEDLKARAHKRDDGSKNTDLINTMFDQIRILAIAEPAFIKPTIGISYHRVSKKCDEEYDDNSKKRKWHKRKPKSERKTRSYEITVDENLRAFHTDFSNNTDSLDLDRYFADAENNHHLIARYPQDVRVVEFKQPDAIGYAGPGKIRRPEAMQGAQRALWQAFVGDLGEKAVRNSKPDSGKFFHVKQFLRLQNGLTKNNGEASILIAPPKDTHDNDSSDNE